MLVSGRTASPQNSSPPNGRGHRTRGGKPAPRYEVLERLGEGSLWIAYRVRDRGQSGPNPVAVTLKALKAAPNRHPRLPTALMDTLDSWHGLSHPALVTPLHVGVEEGTLFWTSEYMAGASLESFLGRGALAPDTVQAVLRTLVPPLAFLHGREMVHGDLRPRQVLFDAGTRAKLTDGGLAKAFVQAGLSLVDLQNEAAYYLAPEITPSVAPTVAADVYALGVVIYRMLTGRVPFDGVSTLSIAARHRADAVMPPTQLRPRLDPKWDDVVLRLLAKDPASRPGAAQLEAWLGEGMAKRGAPATLPDLPPTGQSFPTPTSTAPPTLQPSPAIAVAATGAAIAGATTGGAIVANAGVADAAVPATVVKGLAATAGAAPVADTTPLMGTVPKRRPLDVLAEEELAAQDEEARQRKLVQDRKKFKRREFWGAFAALLWLLVLVGGGVGAGYGAYQYWVNETPVDVTVPKYLGISQDKAQQILSKKGLVLRVVREAYDPKLKEGTVIAGEPEPGRHVRAKREVLVTVSAGLAPIKMVDFAKLTLDQARQIILKHGLRLGPVIQQFHDSVPQGFICGQFPDAGASLRRSEPITLIVSRGPQPTTIDAQDGSVPLPQNDSTMPAQVAPEDDSSFVPLEPAGEGATPDANGLVTRRATIRVKVPSADGSQVVRIIVRDARGERTVYQRAHHAGDLISQTVSATRANNQQALVRIYVGEELIKEEQL